MAYLSYNMYSPSRILFGSGMLKTLHNYPMPGKKALIVISNGKTAYVSGGLEQLKRELELAGVEYAIYDGVKPNPSVPNVTEGVKVARDNGCDFVVALGGGSVMDCGKAISLMVKQKHDYWYCHQHTQEVVAEWLPVITVATDAGTGSESDPFFVVTNEDEHIKNGFPLAKQLGTYPVITVMDPELHRSVPTDFTAYQGFDAMFHSIEGYISGNANLISDMYTLTCIENVYHNLETAVKNGSDIAARERIAFGCNLSSIVMFVGSTTSEHSLEHALSAYHFSLPHGAGLLMLCRAYFKKCIDMHACDERFIKLAQIMGKPDASEPTDFLEMLEKLMKACGVDGLRMSDYGVTRDEFPKFIVNARETMAYGFNADRYKLTDEDCMEIYEASFK